MKIRKLAKLAVIPIGLLTSGLMVLGFSNAAFTAQTPNAGNQWKSGSVSLTNTLTKPMFDYTAAPAGKGSADALLVPGAPVSNTIQVNYTGNTTANIRIYAALGADTGSMAQYLNVTINDGATNVYTGTLANLASTKTNFATGIPGWSPTGAASKTYTFTVTMDPSTPNSAQNASIGATTFTWEAQSP